MATEVRTVGGHTYLYEIEFAWDKEAKRSRKVSTRYLGPCDVEGKLLGRPKVRVDTVHSAAPIGSLAVFYAAAKDLRLAEEVRGALGVDGPTASRVLVLGLNQLVAHAPLSHIDRWAQATPLMRWENLTPEEVSHAALEGALSRLCRLTSQGILENPGQDLQRRLTSVWRGNSREPASYYYDVTKQPYYGTECPYAEWGHDSHGGISPVIGFGLVTSRHHHHPVLCRPLPGALNDQRTVPETVEALRASGFEHLTLILDRGMVSRPNVEYVVQAGYEQVGIVPETHREVWDYVAKWPAEQLEQARFVVARPSGEAAYARAWTAPLMGFQKMRVAVIENPTRKVESRQARDLALLELKGTPSAARVRELREQLRGVVRPSAGRRGFVVDDKAVEGKRARDGRYLMFSTDLSLDAEEMFTIYFQRDVIEKAFRTWKGELFLGPIRYRRKDRLEAYATVVYVAYLLWSWAERKLREKYPAMTLTAALDLLENVEWVRFGEGKRIHEWTTARNKKQEQVLDALGATPFLPGPHHP